ncbi:hypothetical protein SUGI_0381200 [Cryptomeria japonica]|nr:hypothetical protein SUGI_0381200 [Cryptomeria japonica]
MPRNARYVCVAGVLNHSSSTTLQMLSCLFHRVLQLYFVSLVRVNAQHYVFPTHKVKLRRRIVGAGHCQHVSHSVTIQSYTATEENKNADY